MENDNLQVSFQTPHDSRDGNRVAREEQLLVEKKIHLDSLGQSDYVVTSASQPVTLQLLTSAP